MSFFKDFKEDLSQAVNELMPDENMGSKGMDPLMNDAMAHDSDKFAGQDDDIANLLNQVDSFTSPETDSYTASAGAASEQEALKIDVIPSPSDEPSQVMDERDSQPVPVIRDEPSGDPYTWNSTADPAVPLTQPAQATEPVKAPAGNPSMVPEYNPEAFMHEAQAPVQRSEQYSAPQYSMPQHEAEHPQPAYAQTPSQPAYAQTPSQPQPEPPKAFEQDRKPVEPVFKENSYRPSPINTTGVKTGKETGVVIEGMSVTGDIIADGNLE
nr:hypothetical protein [Lachnospiraceae bacterium]